MFKPENERFTLKLTDEERTIMTNSNGGRF